MRSGDEAGFREFAGERALPLRRTAFLLCGDWHLAEDLVQVALIKLYRVWPKVARTGPVDNYARQVLLRCWLDERRRPWRRNERRDGVVPEEPRSDPADAGTSISFVDHEGKGHSFNLGLAGRLTVSRNMLPVAQACSLNGSGRCDKLPRPDGSTAVIFGSSAVHYRADGTAVDITDLGRVSSIAASELGLPADVSPSGRTFDDRQLIALVTDPGFTAQ